MFTKIILSNGDVVEMEHANGGHYMMAAFMCGTANNPMLLGLNMIIVICKVQGKQMTEDYFKKLNQDDINSLAEAFAAQSVKVKGL